MLRVQNDHIEALTKIHRVTNFLELKKGKILMVHAVRKWRAMIEEQSKIDQSQMADLSRSSSGIIRQISKCPSIIEQRQKLASMPLPPRPQARP